MFNRCCERVDEILDSKKNHLISFEEDGLSIRTIRIVRELIACNMAVTGEDLCGFQEDKPELNRQNLIGIATQLTKIPLTSKDICDAAIKLQTHHVFKDGNHRTAMYLYYNMHMIHLLEKPLMEPYELHGYLTVYKFFLSRHMKGGSIDQEMWDRLYKHTRTESIGNKMYVPDSKESIGTTYKRSVNN